mgnify:CR=1 FL=1
MRGGGSSEPLNLIQLESAITSREQRTLQLLAANAIALEANRAQHDAREAKEVEERDRVAEESLALLSAKLTSTTREASAVRSEHARMIARSDALARKEASATVQIAARLTQAEREATVARGLAQRLVDRLAATSEDRASLLAESDAMRQRLVTAEQRANLEQQALLLRLAAARAAEDRACGAEERCAAEVEAERAHCRALMSARAEAADDAAHDRETLAVARRDRQSVERDIEAKLAVANERAVAALAAQQRGHAEQLEHARVNSALTAALSEMRSRHADAIATLAAEHTTEIDLIRISHESDLVFASVRRGGGDAAVPLELLGAPPSDPAAQARALDLADRLESANALASQRGEQVSRMRSKLVAVVQAAESQRNELASELRTEEARLAAMREVHSDEMARLRGAQSDQECARDAALAELRESHDAQLWAMAQSHRVKDAEQQRALADSRHDTDVASEARVAAEAATITAAATSREAAKKRERDSCRDAAVRSTALQVAAYALRVGAARACAVRSEEAVKRVEASCASSAAARMGVVQAEHAAEVTSLERVSQLRNAECDHALSAAKAAEAGSAELTAQLVLSRREADRARELHVETVKRIERRAEAAERGQALNEETIERIAGELASKAADHARAVASAEIACAELDALLAHTQEVATAQLAHLVDAEDDASRVATLEGEENPSAKGASKWALVQSHAAELEAIHAQHALALAEVEDALARSETAFAAEQQGHNEAVVQLVKTQQVVRLSRSPERKRKVAHARRQRHFSIIFGSSGDAGDSPSGSESDEDGGGTDLFDAIIMEGDSSDDEEDRFDSHAYELQAMQLKHASDFAGVQRALAESRASLEAEQGRRREACAELDVHLTQLHQASMRTPPSSASSASELLGVMDEVARSKRDLANADAQRQALAERLAAIAASAAAVKTHFQSKVSGAPKGEDVSPQPILLRHVVRALDHIVTAASSVSTSGSASPKNLAVRADIYAANAQDASSAHAVTQLRNELEEKLRTIDQLSAELAAAKGSSSSSRSTTTASSSPLPSSPNSMLLRVPPSPEATERRADASLWKQKATELAVALKASRAMIQARINAAPTSPPQELGVAQREAIVASVKAEYKVKFAEKIALALDTVRKEAREAAAEAASNERAKQEAALAAMEVQCSAALDRERAERVEAVARLERQCVGYEATIAAARGGAAQTSAEVEEDHDASAAAKNASRLEAELEQQQHDHAAVVAAAEVRFEAALELQRQEHASAVASAESDYGSKRKQEQAEFSDSPTIWRAQHAQLEQECKEHVAAALAAEARFDAERTQLQDEHNAAMSAAEELFEAQLEERRGSGGATAAALDATAEAHFDGLTAHVVTMLAAARRRRNQAQCFRGWRAAHDTKLHKRMARELEHNLRAEKEIRRGALVPLERELALIKRTNKIRETLKKWRGLKLSTGEPRTERRITAVRCLSTFFRPSLCLSVSSLDVTQTPPLFLPFPTTRPYVQRAFVGWNIAVHRGERAYQRALSRAFGAWTKRAAVTCARAALPFWHGRVHVRDRVMHVSRGTGTVVALLDELGRAEIHVAFSLAPLDEIVTFSSMKKLMPVVEMDDD